MTFKEFKKLSKGQQEELLWGFGVELGRSNDALYSYVLYQVYGFYMEVKYCRKMETVEQIACFEDMSLIELYLPDFKIDELFK